MNNKHDNKIIELENNELKLIEGGGQIFKAAGALARLVERAFAKVALGDQYDMYRWATC